MKEMCRRLVSPILTTISSIYFRRNNPESKLALRIWTLNNKYISFLGLTKSKKTVFGLEMEVSTDPRVEKEIFYFGEWEPLLTRYLQDKPFQNSIFLDIGANIGYFTLLASQKYRHVHAVEASPKIGKRLLSNITKNDIQNITVHKVAIGEKAGKIDFFYNTSQSGGSSIFKSEGREYEATVDVINLASILNQTEWANVGFIKIDIEGAEIFALKSLLDISQHLSSNLEILVEYFSVDTTHKRDISWSDIESFMLIGFSVYILQEEYSIEDYFNKKNRTKLKKILSDPSIHCDLLITKNLFD